MDYENFENDTSEEGYKDDFAREIVDLENSVDEESANEDAESQHIIGTVKKKSIGHEIVTTLLYVVAALCLALILNRFVIQKVEVSQESMYDTLEDGDQLFVEKVTNYFSNPNRFDIVVFEAPTGSVLDNGKYWIKRVIGLPGETIQMKEDGVYINGEKIEEGYVDGEMGDPGMIETPITLDEDEYFLMGDNREVSQDCRVVGPINKEAMMGRVCLRIWPLGKFGTVD